MNVSVYNGGGQSDYLYGLVSGLSTTPIKNIDILDINLAEPLFNKFENVRFHEVYKYQKKGSTFSQKAKNLLRFYYLQAKHLVTSKCDIIHFQWLDRFYFADRIVLPLMARLSGHRVVLTVHNVNALKRDNRDTFYNRLTLKLLYRICNHLIVHTEKSKTELISDFKVVPEKISVIRHGMNNKVSRKGLSQSQAREALNIPENKKVVLFFGNIDYYKGLDILLDSLPFLSTGMKKDFILLIAGNYKSADYIRKIREQISGNGTGTDIIAHVRYIEDDEIERYFMASNCIVLPYREIYQSGVLFMAYNFGLPIVATKVGNFENDIIEGKTGLLIDDITPEAVARSIELFFTSEIFHDQEGTRTYIQDWSNRQFSWENIGDETFRMYLKISS